MTSLLLTLKLGWRNLWRNPRRSLITTGAFAAAYAFVIAEVGILEGLKFQLLGNGTLLLLGHLQIHAQTYLPDRGLYDTIGGEDGIDVAALLSELEHRSESVRATPRVQAFGLVSLGDHSAGAELLGIDPRREVRVTTLIPREMSGRLGETGSRFMLLGDVLARELGARPGDEVAVVTQAADGSLGNNLFTIAATVHTGLSHLDRSLAVMHLGDLQALLSLGPRRIHEIAVVTGDVTAADSVTRQLNRSGLLPRGSAARSWGDLSPQLKDYVSLTEGMNGLVIFLVALFAGFGVLNTMMMAVFERTREIGMLQALGTGPSVIVTSILAESIILAAVGTAAGFGLGALLMRFLVERGIDLSRWVGELSMIGTRFDPVLHGAWAVRPIGYAAAGLVAAAAVAALIPARRAVRMNPVVALTAPTEG